MVDWRGVESMKRFTRITNGVATEHYITSIRDGCIYYGYFVPGHENKKATACMTIAGYNRLCEKEQLGVIYTDGCTGGKSIPCVSQIIGGTLI